MVRNFFSLYKGDSVGHAVLCIREPDKLAIAYAKIREFYDFRSARKFENSKKMAILYEIFFLDCSLFSRKVCSILLPNREKNRFDEIMSQTDAGGNPTDLI